MPADKPAARAAETETPCLNTDRELWRERPDDYYADSLHVTQGGSIGINCGGHVIVLPIREWHRRAGASPLPAPAGGTTPTLCVCGHAEEAHEFHETPSWCMNCDECTGWRPVPAAPAGAGTPGGETFDLAQQLNDFFNATQDGDEDAGQIAQDAIVDEFTRLAARLSEADARLVAASAALAHEQELAAVRGERLVEADAAREAAEQLVAAAIEVNQRYIGGSPLKGAFGDALDRLATAQFNASRTLAAARAALAAPPTGAEESR